MAGAIIAIWAMPTRWAGSLSTTATSHGKTIVWIPKLGEPGGDATESNT